MFAHVQIAASQRQRSQRWMEEVLSVCRHCARWDIIGHIQQNVLALIN